MNARAALSRAVIVGLVTLMAAGCTPQRFPRQRAVEPTSSAVTSRAEIPVDVTGLADALTAAGLEATASGTATGGVLGDPAQYYRVSADGSMVQVYRFSSSQQAMDVASEVSADGTGLPAAGGWAQVEWMGRPHFFRRDRLIVLYLSARDLSTDTATDSRILRVLQQQMGRQFAGS